LELTIVALQTVLLNGAPLQHGAAPPQVPTARASRQRRRVLRLTQRTRQWVRRRQLELAERAIDTAFSLQASARLDRAVLVYEKSKVATA
jgi:hypothetical protein